MFSPTLTVAARRPLAVVLLGLLTLVSNVVAAQEKATESALTPALAIEHVTVLPMKATGEQRLSDVTVLIRSGRITYVGPGAGTTISNGTKVIDGRGKWLMPGLVDMHVHIENDRMLRLYLRDPSQRDGTLHNESIFIPYVANGVLQVFDLSAMPETIGQRIQIESGHLLGPHIALAAMIDGPPPILPVGMTRVAATPEDGRQAVRDAAAEGYEFIKTYSRLSLETFTAIVDEARRARMRVVGHIPQRERGLTDRFFQPGYDLVAHAEEFAQQTNPPALELIPHYVELAKRNGTELIATLSLDDRILEETSHPETLKNRPEIRYLAPPWRTVVLEHNPYVAQAGAERIAALQRIVDFNRALVRAFAAAGVPVLAGTDSPVPGVVPGFSIHDELEAMAAAGMTNQQVLEGATRLAYLWLGVEEDRGTVEQGKRADLLLLDGDPLENVSNTRRIAAVVLGGRYLPRSELARLLAASCIDCGPRVDSLPDKSIAARKPRDEIAGPSGSN